MTITILRGPAWTIYVADVRDGLAELDPQSVHAVVTSPPYWRLRCYNVAGQLGQEATPAEFVQNLVTVYGEMAWVMRHDAVFCLNIGDTYFSRGGGGAGGSFGAERRAFRDRTVWPGVPRLFQEGSMAMIPERLAIALQEHRWLIRNRFTWHKPNAMPESMPDRCARDDEAVFALTRSRRHYWDRLGVMFPASSNTHSRGHGVNPKALLWDERLVKANARFRKFSNGLVSERRCRTVWTIPTAPYRGAHFAAFPPALAERCLLLTTSRAGVCRQCGTPLKRLVHSNRVATRPGRVSKCHADADGAMQSTERIGNRDPERHVTHYETIGWAAGCDCSGAIVRPAKSVVLDPMAGVCSTGIACLRLGLEFIGIELNPESAQLGHERLQAEWDRLQRVVPLKKPQRRRRFCQTGLLFPMEIEA